MSTNVQYHYITLNRILDVASGEFELSIGGDTVYRLDTNDSTVNLQLNDRGNDKIPLISKRRIDVGSGGFDKIIISWTGLSVPQTLELLIGDSQKRSDVVGVELSDFSTTVTGSTSSDITKIAGSSVFAEDFGETFEAINPQSNQLYFAWEVGTASNVNVFTVPANREYYMQYIQYNALTGNSGITTDSRITSLDSGGSTKFQFARILATQAPTTIGAPIPSTFSPTPIRFTAGEILQVQSQTTNFNISGSCYITEVVV